MNNKFIKGTILVTGTAAVYSVYKVVKELINYGKLKNRDLYIDSKYIDITNLKNEEHEENKEDMV